ncbi:hypothetical protein OF83DRAFT_1083633 [Amylostereum chailletii]|nr:hypothetical protein OF83DRAFT_1083633 [Amylostereum chailletii]
MPETIESLSYFVFITQVHFCSMYAVLVWDWITSIRKEYDFIWKSKWTPIKGLYLFCRYWLLIVMPYVLWCYTVNHSWETCLKVYKSPVALAMWNQVGAELVLLLRTYAFFGRNKMMLAAMLTALGGIIGYQLWVDTSRMPPLPFLDQSPNPKGPCLPMSRPGEAHLLGFFVAPLAFDSVVTALTVGKALLMHRRLGPSSPVIQVFLREGVFYYILIAGANLINGIFYFQRRAAMSAIMIPLSIMLSPLLACRLILDIRSRAANRDKHHSASAGSRTGRSQPFGIQFSNQRNHHHPNADPLETYGNITTGIATTHDAGIELRDVDDAKDTKDNRSDSEVDAYYGAVKLPINGIRIDVEKGFSER